MKAYWVLSIDMVRSSQLKIGDAERARVYSVLENYCRFLLNNAEVADHEYLWAGEGGFALLDASVHEPVKVLDIAEAFLRHASVFLTATYLRIPRLPALKFRVTIGLANAVGAARLSNAAGWMLSVLLKYERDFGKEGLLTVHDDFLRQLPEGRRELFTAARKVRGRQVWDAASNTDEPTIVTPPREPDIQGYLYRGDTQATALYASIINHAVRRIWAIGMSNRSFFAHHFDALVSIIETQPVDVVIAFWDPRTRVTLRAPSDLPVTLLDIQRQLEGNSPMPADWDENDIRQRYVALVDRVSAAPARRGSLSVYYLSLPTNFSCLVVDDELFFFPFLAGPSSPQQPTLRLRATSPIGTSVVKHFEQVLYHSHFAQAATSVAATT